MLLLAPKLSVLCPPQDVTTTTTTTTEISIDQCLCNEAIEEIREQNLALGVQVEDLQLSNVEQNNNIEQLNERIEQLKQSNEKLTLENAAFEKRFLEIEMQLREIGSRPCSN